MVYGPDGIGWGRQRTQRGVKLDSWLFTGNRKGKQGIECGLWNETDGVLIPVLPHTHCVTLGDYTVSLSLCFHTGEVEMMPHTPWVVWIQ